MCVTYIIAAASTILVPASIYGGVYLRNKLSGEGETPYKSSQVDELKRLAPGHEDASVLLTNPAGDKSLAEDPATLKQKADILAAHRDAVAQKIRDAEERQARKR
ncbi:hypothetical protein FRC03_005808 [Tulasnella sp. 419]|nr:hypothetical protein FRC03_005808 [Tulasnella sp. 419]